MGIILYNIRNTIINLDEDLNPGEFKLEYKTGSDNVNLFKNMNKINKQDTIYICTLSGHRLTIFIKNYESKQYELLIDYKIAKNIEVDQPKFAIKVPRDYNPFTIIYNKSDIYKSFGARILNMDKSTKILFNPDSSIN